MTISIFVPNEQALLDAWFRSAPIDGRLDELLKADGFEDECDPYTRLDAWVGAFAVAEIQARLPNAGICSGPQVTLTRTLREVKERTVSGLTRHLFTINWADSAPGISWPVAYTLVWVPLFDHFVVAASADGGDAFGYPDFAIGRFPARGSWLEAVKDIIVRDWRAQYDGWNQAPWAYLFDTDNVSEADALKWRAEAWLGTEFDEWSSRAEGESEEVAS